MLKSILIFFCFQFFLLAGFSQIQTETKEKVYAVVVGIANYESRNIPNLNYSNRDAEVFADWLQSIAGGSVPKENIRLMIDTNATTAAIYNSLGWLKNKCEEDWEEDSTKVNTIYFYFSGHGDLESQTLRQLGYLLAYNTPSNNYLNNAVRIEDLNYYANTLSVGLNAKVILITDACHTGKLAGSNKQGSFLVGKQLGKARSKEIRLAACAPDELSNEDPAWGGGRGVFSYYLLNGMTGLADRNNDNSITLNEIKNYLDSSFANDQVLKENKKKQTPVFDGNQSFQLASVNQQELARVQLSVMPVTIEQSDQDYFFSLLKQRELLESTEFENMIGSPKLKACTDLISNILEYKDSSIQFDKLKQLREMIKNDSTALQSFIENLVETLHNSGQKLINLYLEGDVAELERRAYYHSRKTRYEVYPEIYQFALQFVPPDLPLARILKLNLNYFSGLVARLKIPTAEPAEQIKLTDQAIGFQKKALAMEEEAAFIHNELGILTWAKKDFTGAKKYFIRATELAPNWALPWANLC